MRSNRSETVANREMAAGIRKPRPAARSPRWSLPVTRAARWAAVLLAVAFVAGELLKLV